jgi:hypothetical protein
MTKKISLICLICFGIGIMAMAQKLDKFGADLAKKTVMGKEIRVPYTSITSYYGFVKPGAVPDETREGKKFYYLYVWIPIAAPELGIRMASPIPKGMKPEKEDFVGAEYNDNASNTTDYFDTWITLERANGILSADNIGNGKTANWSAYDSNDDSGEMPAQPSGNKYNSLMRITSDINNPLKSLVVGLYRIGFTTYKVGEVKGGFLAQIGAPVKLPGVCIASNLDDLMKQVKK